MATTRDTAGHEGDVGYYELRELGRMRGRYMLLAAIMGDSEAEPEAPASMKRSRRRVTAELVEA